MEPSEPGEVTRLLKAWSGGDRSALERLVPQIYSELHKLAKRHMDREVAGQTLQTTALVNEVYLRLVEIEKMDLQHRAQFFALSAQIMRHILVDAARARHSLKRGAGAVRVTLDEAPGVLPEPDISLLALNEALDELSEVAPREAKVVELRYFGGMNEAETAEAMQTSPRSVSRDWNFARAWLMRRLGAKPE